MLTLLGKPAVSDQQNLVLKPLHREGEQMPFLIKSETESGITISTFKGFNGWADVVGYTNEKGKIPRKTIEESDLKAH